jgi:hypothetical protein
LTDSVLCTNYSYRLPDLNSGPAASNFFPSTLA